MIENIFTGDGHAPRVVCDYCHKPIDDASSGMVLLRQSDDVETAEVKAFIHKGDCDKHFEGGARQREGWVELRHFLARLCHNTGLKGAKLEEAFSEIGRLQDYP